jgi:hypothetical protein
MSRSIFEVIEYEKKMPAKIFITSIEQSYYHWHFDYEFLLVFKKDHFKFQAARK